MSRVAHEGFLCDWLVEQVRDTSAIEIKLALVGQEWVGQATWVGRVRQVGVGRVGHFPRRVCARARSRQLESTRRHLIVGVDLVNHPRRREKMSLAIFFSWSYELNFSLLISEKWMSHSTAWVAWHGVCCQKTSSEITPWRKIY